MDTIAAIDSADCRAAVPAGACWPVTEVIVGLFALVEMQGDSLLVGGDIGAARGFAATAA